MIKLTQMVGVFALGAMVALTGCAKEVDESPASTEHFEGDGHDHSHDNATQTAEAPSPELKKVVLTSGAPAQVVGVSKARETAADGQDIAIEGRLKDFIAGKAAFTVVDGSIQSCLEDGEDCKTPWDYCCVAPNKLAANSATIKIVDGEGKMLEGNLKGVNNIDNLTTVVVTGKAEKDAAGNLTIAANNVYVK